MKNSEILSYTFGTKYSYMPKDVKYTLNQIYNDRLKMKRKKRKSFNKRNSKNFTNHIYNKTSAYKRKNITYMEKQKQQNKFNMKGGECDENKKRGSHE